MSVMAIRATNPHPRGLVSAQGSIARFTNPFAQHLHVNGEDAFLMKLRRAAAVDDEQR